MLMASPLVHSCPPAGGYYFSQPAVDGPADTSRPPSLAPGTPRAQAGSSSGSRLLQGTGPGHRKAGTPVCCQVGRACCEPASSDLVVEQGLGIALLVLP